ncbi:hypothetical protein [Corynebacterium callunae]|uniref:hypothetical protein n=1 Tax=Corynebacterium callunae TaxID=1721 RepID=UPI0012DF7EDD|nr:hypothetical protein [Corynebacterium callunae]
MSRNVAIGHQALMRNRGGDRNVAVGPFAGHNIISGRENVIMGVDCLWQGEGSRNIAIGMYAMDKADGANDTIAIGRRAASFATSGAWNIAIGDDTMQATNPGSGNVAVGRGTLSKNAGYDHNVAVGNYAARENSGIYNVAVGAEALHGAVGANATETIAIGYRAGYSITTARRNTLVGHQAGREITTGSTNIVMGNLAAPTLASGANNVLIGYDVARGKVSGDNCIIVGGVPYSENPDVTGWLNIANTIYGRRSEKNVGIGVEYPAAHLHIMASSGAPGSAPLRFSPGPLMDTALSGNMEYDGTDLYFTIGNVRKKIAFQTT